MMPGSFKSLTNKRYEMENRMRALKEREPVRYLYNNFLSLSDEFFRSTVASKPSATESWP